MFTPQLESASKNFPAIPRFCFIPSPTMLTTATFSTTSMGLTRPSRISKLNSPVRTSFTRTAWLCFTQNEIVYSEEDCVIRSMLIPARLTVENTRLAIPVLPFIPEPLTEIRAMFLRHEMPRTGPTFFSESKGPLPMRVPRAFGFWLLRLHASMPFAARGARVFGCRTFEPKNESSIASS